MPVKPIPDDYQGVIPALAFQGAAAAIDFYQKAFGAIETMRMTGPDGKIGHAELKIGSGKVMLSDEYPEYNKSPKTLGGAAAVFFVYVEDVDSVLERAIAAGARSIMPATDKFYGDRSGRIEDPFGYTWVFSTHKEDMSREELRRRFDEMSRTEGQTGGGA